MNKYHAIIKAEDVNRYLLKEERRALRQLLITIDIGRVSDGKAAMIENKYAVINLDEPYADEVIEIMKKNGHDIND